MTGKYFLPVSFLLGALSVYITLSASPYIQQSFFWIDGFRAYTLPIIIFGGTIVLYYLIIDKIRTIFQISVAVFFAFLLSLANGGLSETFAVFQFTVLLLGIGYYWAVERPIKFDAPVLVLFASWVGSVIAIVIIITAPGNAVRQQFFPPPPGILDILSISINSYVTFIKNLIGTPHKIMAILGGIFCAAWIGNTIDGNFNLHKKKILLLPALALGLSFACFPPGVYGYSDAPPDRVLIIATFILTSLLMSAGFWAGNLAKISIADQRKIRLALAIAIPILVLSSTAIMSINLYGSRMEYIEYANAWDKTDSIIRVATTEGQEIVTVKTVPNWAGMDQLNDNPKHWVNECYSFFYGIQVFGEN